MRLGAGPGPGETDGLHSFRGHRAGPIPLTGGSIAQSSGVGAVNLAENVFKMLHLGSQGGGEHSRRSSLNRDNPPVQAVAASQQSANLESAPNTSRRGSGGAEESKQDSARIRNQGSDAGAGGGQNTRRSSQNEKRMSGGSLTRQLTGTKKNMIPLGRVGTLRALALQSEGGKESHRDSRIPSKPISRVNSKLSNGSSAGGPDEDPTANNQEIEGLEEFNAAHKIETAAAIQKRMADGGGTDAAPTEDGDGDEAVRAAIEAKRLEKKPVSALGLKVLGAIDSGWGTLVMTLATIYCLFGDDIRVIGCPPSSDPVFWALSTLCFVLFGLEFAAFCKWQEGYFLSFFFFLDLIACFSLIPDLPFIWDPFMQSIGQGDAQKQNIAVARAGRASRAGTRAGRLVRFIRLVRFLRVSKLYKYCGETDEEREKRELEEKMEEADRLKREAEEKLISEMDSEIGKGFSDYITKCVIIMVLFLMFLLPLLEVTDNDTSAAFFVAEMDSIMQGAADRLTAAAGGAAIDADISTQIYTQAPALVLDLIHRFQDRFGTLALHINILAPNSDWATTHATHEVFYLYNDYDIRGLRANEIEKDQGTWATVWISIKPDRQISAIFNLCTTIFVTLLLAGGSALFSHDAHNMVILPIERMFLFVTRLAANPLGKIRPSGDADQPFETRLLESTFMKLAGLLQISFGAAGAEVISHNMHGDFLDPMVPGRKIFAIFGFCDIRKFGVVTEALGQHVMIFCVAEGTLVNMDGGFSKRIEHVSADDVVMALGVDDGSSKTGLVPRRVSQAIRVPHQRLCVELLFADGRTLVCTPDHRIRTAAGKWMQAQDLIVGESEVAAGVEYPESAVVPSITSGVRHNAKVLPLYKVQLIGRRAVGLRTVYDLTVPAPTKQGDDLHSFMAAGIVVHNCNQIADIVHELTHMYGGAANKNIGNAFLLVWKPTVSQIRRVSSMNAALAGLPAGSGDLGNLLGKDKYTGPNTHTISEEEEDEEASTTNVKKAGAQATKGKGEQKEQWASRSPQKNGVPAPAFGGVEAPIAAAPIAAEHSESSHAGAAHQASETDQNNLNQPQPELTTVPALSGSDSSSSLPALFAGRGANRLTLPVNGSGAGLNVRGSVSVANALASNATGIESSSAGVGHSEYLSPENGVDAEFTTTKLEGDDADKKGHTGLTVATSEDSPVHKQRRGSAHLIPTAIPEVSKSHQEHESQNAASHREGPATTLPAHLKPAPSAGAEPSPRGVARRESYLGAGSDTRQGPMWEAMKHLADQAMVAFLSTVREVAITQELAHWRANENMMKLLAAEPGQQYQVDMGFGLHVGWAIEGAIGSIYKIDASYLSPNVNIASRLCGATKQYGVRLLISGPLYSLMQPEIQKRCRHLDRITVKGSKLPLDVYTFDVGALALRPPGAAASPPAASAASASSTPVIVVTPASPVTAAAADSHAVVIPKSGAIPLGSLAARPAGSSIRGDADIEVDDQGNVVPQHPDPHREHAAAVEEQAEEFLVKQNRRGSRVMSNGKKVIDSITMAMGLKKEAAQAQDSVAPPATKPASQPHGSKVQPEEMLPTAGQPVTAASPNEHKGADAAGSVELTNLRPVALHLGTPTSSNASDVVSPSPAAAALADSSPSAPLGGSAVVLTSPPNSPPGKPKPKVDSGDFTPASLAAICAQLQLGLPDDFVRVFNEASGYYIAGKWGKARAILEGKILTVAPNDKPSKVLLSIMAEKDYHAPKDWPGFRALTSK